MVLNLARRLLQYHAAVTGRKLARTVMQCCQPHTTVGALP